MPILYFSKQILASKVHVVVSGTLDQEDAERKTRDGWVIVNTVRHANQSFNRQADFAVETNVLLPAGIENHILEP